MGIVEVAGLWLAAFSVFLNSHGKVPAWTPVSLHRTLQHLLDNSILYSTACVLLFGILEYVRNKIETWKLLKEIDSIATARDKDCAAAISAVLSYARDKIVMPPFKTQPGVEHRLTLFRANKEETRLNIFARSCISTSGSPTSWAIDRNDRDKCEGVAGMTWFLALGIPRENLPDISSKPSAKDVNFYAEQTFVSADHVRQHGWRARSYLTSLVRVCGKDWGVLVLDSIHVTIPMPEGSRDRRMIDVVAHIGGVIAAWTR